MAVNTKTFTICSALVSAFLASCDDAPNAPVGPPAGKATECSLPEILAGKAGCAEDPSLDEVPEGYEEPADTTATAATDTMATADGDTTSTSVTSVQSPVDAPAAEVDTFNIEVVFLPPSGEARDFTHHEKQLILKAARRWEEKFLHGVPAAYPNDAYTEGPFQPYYSFPPLIVPDKIDDILVYVTSSDRGYWGEAYNFGGFLPKLDVVNSQPMGIVAIGVEAISKYYDDDYYQFVYRQYTDVLIEDVVAHEIGHILQGPEWWDFFRRDDRGYPYFDGFHAKDQFDFYLSQGGISYTGIKVPLYHADNNQVQHWYSDYMYRGVTSDGRYQVFDFGGNSYRGNCWGAEIMSYASGQSGCHDAISRVTLGALKDLGYPVDMSKADYYRFSQGTFVKGQNPFESSWGRPSPKLVIPPLRCGVGLEPPL